MKIGLVPRMTMVLLLSLAVAGCGTIATRRPHALEPRHVYRATAFDCRNLEDVVSPKHGATGINSMIFRTLVGVFVLVDVPISLTTDTACLPWDIYQSRIHEEPKEPNPRLEAVGDPGSPPPEA